MAENCQDLNFESYFLRVIDEKRQSMAAWG